MYMCEHMKICSYIFCFQPFTAAVSLNSFCIILALLSCHALPCQCMLCSALPVPRSAFKCSWASQSNETFNAIRQFHVCIYVYMLNARRWNVKNTRAGTYNTHTVRFGRCQESTDELSALVEMFVFASFDINVALFYIKYVSHWFSIWKKRNRKKNTEHFYRVRVLSIEINGKAAFGFSVSVNWIVGKRAFCIFFYENSVCFVITSIEFYNIGSDLQRNAIDCVTIIR